MPRPVRLDHQMVLDQGNTTVDPPLATDVASVPASVAWRSSGLLPTSTYQLFLARYSAKFPAVQEPNGSLIPTERGVLAWVLYASPVTAGRTSCGLWGVDVYDARSGQHIVAAGWSPGP